MVEIKGTFTKRGLSNAAVPAGGSHLRLTLGHDDPDAEFRVVEDGKEVEIYDTEYSILLGYGDGSIPAGTYVRANDEILPAGSYYDIGVEDACYYNERVEIRGDAAVDLTPPPEPEPEPEVVVDPCANMSPRERELWAADAAIVRDGTMRLGKKNRVGFFAGSICAPTNTGMVWLPSGERGTFAVFPFTLPFSAVVNRVSISGGVPADSTENTKKAIISVGLYDASGAKRCDASIAVGCSTGIFPEEVALSEGDYFLAWKTDRPCNVQLRGLGVVDRPDRLGVVEQFYLVNASGVLLMGVGQSKPGAGLPDTMGVISREYGRTYGPPLVYFKA